MIHLQWIILTKNSELSIVSLTIIKLTKITPGDLVYKVGKLSNFVPYRNNLVIPEHLLPIIINMEQ